MYNSNWYIITGGPCSGKTTTIELLKKRGYTTIDEAARIYFEQEMEKGFTNDEIRANPQKLQDNILLLQIAMESQYPLNQTLFLDRAIPDSFGYFSYRGLEETQILTESRHDHYRKVFFLERLPVKKDAVRTESEEELQAIEWHIYEAYKKLGFELIPVPVMEQEKRIDFILKYINTSLS